MKWLEEILEAIRKWLEARQDTKPPADPATPTTDPVQPDSSIVWSKRGSLANAQVLAGAITDASQNGDLFRLTPPDCVKQFNDGSGNQKNWQTWFFAVKRGGKWHAGPFDKSPGLQTWKGTKNVVNGYFSKGEWAAPQMGEECCLFLASRGGGKRTELSNVFRWR